MVESRRGHHAITPRLPEHRPGDQRPDGRVADEFDRTITQGPSAVLAGPRWSPPFLPFPVEPRYRSDGGRGAAVFSCKLTACAAPKGIT